MNAEPAIHPSGSTPMPRSPAAEDAKPIGIQAVSRRPIIGAGSHRRRWNFAALAFLLLVFAFAFLINWPA